MQQREAALRSVLQHLADKPVAHPEQRRRSGGGRVREHFRRRALLNDAALRQQHHPVGHGRQTGVVRGGERGHGQLVHARHQLGQHIVAGAAVERRGRLVEQQHLGLAGQRARQGHALLLPARELRGTQIDLLAQPDRLQQLRRGLPPRAQAPAPGIGHVLPRAQVRKQGIALRQVAHGPALRRQATKRRAVAGNQSGQGLQDRGFALATGSQQGREAAHLEFDVERNRLADLKADLQTHEVTWCAHHSTQIVQ